MQIKTSIKVNLYTIHIEKCVISGFGYISKKDIRPTMWRVDAHIGWERGKYACIHLPLPPENNSFFLTKDKLSLPNPCHLNPSKSLNQMGSIEFS